MSQFMQVYNPVEEGWGFVMGRIALGAGAGAAGYALGTKAAAAASVGKATTAYDVAAPAVGAGLGFGTSLVERKFTEKMMKDITSNAKFKKYIEAQCDKELANLKKTFKDITPEVNPSGFFAALKAIHAGGSGVSWAEAFQSISIRAHNNGRFYKVGKYNINIYFDTDHIYAVMVVFGFKNDKGRFVGRRIAAPTGGELKKLYAEKK